MEKTKLLILIIILACSFYLVGKINGLGHIDNAGLTSNITESTSYLKQGDDYMSLKQEVVSLSKEIEGLRQQLRQSDFLAVNIDNNDSKLTLNNSENPTNVIREGYAQAEIDKSGLDFLRNIIGKGFFDETDKMEFRTTFSTMSGSARDELMLELTKAVNSQQLSVDFRDIF